MHANGSLLSFQQNNNRVSQATGHKDDSLTWEGNFNYNYQWNQMNPKCIADPRLLEEINCSRTASNFNSMVNSEKENHGDWLYSEGTIATDAIQDSVPFMVEIKVLTEKMNMGIWFDHWYLSSQNRRERISERLKILQELVPNGSKVDLVTMLEKAISYVKFLQLQVKVLATDEFWPVQGGKAPDISQVKEAIDAILSSQKDRNSSLSSK
ncbi:hypothetical protein GH714_013777 [Hevea brasiliensis]|uniref:BHLH domain-containing protein n=1 Tax=Hevea brasiliensis TaxID=3981 RepID=A0A6A6LHK6_HEVBR|nr:hypothetical protein GH714_013777 [Hevea brasiliensis]